MKDWWAGLQLREQRLVVALGAVLGIFLFYQLIWQPLATGVDDAQAKLARQQALLAWVEQETARVGTIQNTPSNNRLNGSLSSVINRSAQQQRIVIARLQPQSDSVLVWVENISFNHLLSWLTSLSEEQGIKVLNIDIVKDNTSGNVEVKRLQLGR